MTKNDPRRYSHERFHNLLGETVQELKKLSELKGGEYAGDDDRLANFRRNGAALELNMETVWAVYAAKHWDAVMQYIKDLQNGKERVRLESISGRLDDLIVYSILFKAMVDERGSAGVPEPSSDDRMRLSLNDMKLKGTGKYTGTSLEESEA